MLVVVVINFIGRNNFCTQNGVCTLTRQGDWRHARHNSLFLFKKKRQVEETHKCVAFLFYYHWALYSYLLQFHSSATFLPSRGNETKYSKKRQTWPHEMEKWIAIKWILRSPRAHTWRMDTIRNDNHNYEETETKTNKETIFFSIFALSLFLNGMTRLRLLEDKRHSRRRGKCMYTFTRTAHGTRPKT